MIEIENVFEPYCGGGGTGLGFTPYFNITKAIDIKEEAVKTYQANHPNCKVKLCDIRNISGVYGDFEGITGVVGGPPCQPYSLLNLRKHNDDPRRELTAEFMRLVSEIKPRFWMIENVPYTPQETKAMVLKRGQELGYNVTPIYVNAADYGAAQYRKRWLAVGLKDKHWHIPKPTQPKTVREALQGITTNWGLMKSNPQKLEQLSKTEVGTWKSVSNGKFKNGIRLSWDKPSPAVINLQKVYMVHPEELRNISLAEAAALQGFPPTYHWNGNRKEVAQMIANAMPVELSRSIASSLVN